MRMYAERGYRGRRRAGPRLLVLAIVTLAIVAGLLKWRKARKAEQAASAPPAVQPLEPPPPKPPAKPSAVTSPERATDIEALDRSIAQARQDYDRLRAEVAEALRLGPAQAAVKLRDYPYKVQLVGMTVDRVPLRTVEVRNFQTRFTRMMYEASRALAEVVRSLKRNAGTEQSRALFDASSGGLAVFEDEWKRFAAATPPR